MIIWLVNTLPQHCQCKWMVLVHDRHCLFSPDIFHHLDKLVIVVIVVKNIYNDNYIYVNNFYVWLCEAAEQTKLFLLYLQSECVLLHCLQENLI